MFENADICAQTQWDGTREFVFQTCDIGAIGFGTSLEGQLLQGDLLYYETYTNMGLTETYISKKDCVPFHIAVYIFKNKITICKYLGWNILKGKIYSILDHCLHK